MEDYKTRIKKLRDEILDGFAKLNLDNAEDELKLLNAKTKTTDFWKDNLKAQNIMKQISDIETKLNPWLQLKKNIAELGDYRKITKKIRTRI